MKSHEIADCFPLIGGEDLASLAQDIAANGLRRPITLFQDRILDGRNRFQACELAGVTPVFDVFGGDWDAAVKLVASENLYRRHLTSSQRGWAADKLVNLKPGRPAKTGSIEPVSASRAADLLNVGRETVKRARQVRERGVPELGRAVESGDIAVSAAAELSKLPDDEQREVLAAGKQKVRETVAGLRTPRQSAENALTALASAVTALNLAVQRLVCDNVEITPDLKGAAGEAVAELRSTADWLESIINGEGVTDEALSSWLTDGQET